MTVRSDISFFMELSPRLIRVAAPSVEINIQDLHDTVVAFEDTILGGQYPRLILTAGNEALGGGTFVGLTATLQNAQIEFEPRTAANSEGSATSTGTTVLQDTAATFIADGVLRGALLINFVDESVATVLSIDSETQITHTAFTGGTANDWSVSDTYRITNETQCGITGGNLVAIDSVGNPMPTVFPSLGTQIVRSSSSSATISGLEITNMQRLIESARSSHAAYGNIFYWDPVNGSDSSSGLSPSTAKKTFAAAQALATPFNGDVIFALNGNPAGATTTNETIKITVPRLYLRGPGRVFNIVGNSATEPAVWISVPGSSVEGLAIKQDNAAMPGLRITNHNGLARNTLVGRCAGTGIEITDAVVPGAPNAPVTILDNVESIDNALHACHIHDVVGLTFIRNCHFEESGVDGIRMENTVDDIHVIDTIIHENLGWGINIVDATVSNTAIINPKYVVNGLGDLNDNGTNTTNIRGDSQAVWAHLLETGYSAEQIMRIVASGVAGKASGLETLLPRFRDLNDTKDRIAATTDVNGNRTAVVLDGS